MKKPTVPCRSCGRLLWHHTNSRPPEHRVCRPCVRAGRIPDGVRPNRGPNRSPRTPNEKRDQT